MVCCLQLRRAAAAVAITATLVVTVFATSSSIAAAAGLFDPATATEMRAAPLSAGTMRDALRGPGNNRSLRDRLVSLNAAELARVVPPGADNADNRLERAKAL